MKEKKDLLIEGRMTDIWHETISEKEKLEYKIYKLEEEIAHLREALTFYAELDGNGIQLYGDMDSEAFEFIDGASFPFGTTARNALEGKGFNEE